MNAMTAIRHEPVAIAGCEVLAAIGENGKAYFSPKHVCEAIGIDWKSQHQKINDDPVLASTVVIITMVAADGKNREMTMLPIEMAQGWLFTIKRVSPALQERLNQYRRECFHALHAWFTGREPPQPTRPVTELDALENIVAHLRKQDRRIGRIELEVGKLRARATPRAKLTLVNTHQVGLDLDPQPKAKGEAKGGTHASPSPHARRGHYRTLPDGRKVWVRETFISGGKGEDRS